MTVRRGPGPLGIILGVLILSAGLRAVEPGAALARDLADRMAVPDPPAPAPTTEPPARTCAENAEQAELVAAIRARSDRLDERERRLEARLAALDASEQRLKATAARLIAAEEGLAATLALADSAAERDLDRLTSVYANMKPKLAAGLFAEMAPDFAAGFLARMAPNAAADILSNLDPAEAYTISLVLAGRNARVPRD
jgi:flagellar motility protein MotE (MotC chaperone)